MYGGEVSGVPMDAYSGGYHGGYAAGMSGGGTGTDGDCGDGRDGSHGDAGGNSDLRQPPDAGLCLAELRVPSQLRGVTYPHQYSPTAWPYIGPFYPYPQVPLGWRKVMLEWDDGWWQLDFLSK